MLSTKMRTPSIVACLLLTTCLHALGQQFDASQIFNAWQNRQPGLTLVGSHRGEVNGAYANNKPENSIGAFRNAEAAGIEVVEMDVWTTQDHYPYLMHDTTLTRMLQMNIRSNYNPDPNGSPGVYWNQINNMVLCGGRGVTPVANGGTGQCTDSGEELVPSLFEFLNEVLLHGTDWGGVVSLDIRDADSLVQSWSTLMELAPRTLSNRVVFKLTPLRLGLFSPQDIANLLATSSYYNGNSAQALADMQAYMNVQFYYVGNTAIAQEQATGDPNWAIHDWTNWLTNAGSFHRLLSPEVDVKGNPGEFMTADTLYQTVTSGPLNTVGVYSTYFDCTNPSGPQNLPNLPPGAAGLNGYWTDNGTCKFLTPKPAESADGIDHRYDYNFVTGNPTSVVANPPSFGMILADTAGVLINYLQGIGQRNLRAIEPPCASGSAYPGCNDPNNPGETTYTLCAPEGGTCTFTGDRNVVFGANGSYSPAQTFANETACRVGVFNDPLPGVVKACYVSPPIGYRVPSFGTAQKSYGMIYCADEGQYCPYDSSGFAAIAADGSYTSTFFNPAGYQCDVKQTFYVFGDPAPGFQKACFYSIPQYWAIKHFGPAGYQYCASQGNTCHFKGPGRVAYGETPTFGDPKFAYGVFNGGTFCDVSVFGDPAPGVTKDCYYQVETAASKVGGTGTAGNSGTRSDLGPNVTVINPGMSPASINSLMNTLNQESQFSTNRHAILFQPGTYGTASAPVISQVGFYEQIAGLGLSPDEVSITGGFYADQLINGNMTQNFWRSQENMAVEPTGGPTPGVIDWGVSQGASLRRMFIDGGVWYANSQPIGTLNACQESSGGFTADSQIRGTVNACSQQQWYTRDSLLIGGFTGYVWNFVFSGVPSGAPAQSFPGGPAGDANVTVLSNTPNRKEKPFLFVDSNGNYNLFGPTYRSQSFGTDWPNAADPGNYTSLTSFYFIADPNSQLSDINHALSNGYGLILTPGIYKYSGAIHVTVPNTHVLGLGYATLVPQAGNPAIVVDDVDGVQVAGLIIDAGPVNSPILMEVGQPGVVNQSHAGDPTSLNDVFFRIGGATAGSATTSLEVDSGNVILDNIWAWRADHGNPGTFGWNINTAAHGVVVNGNNVTALGLAVEHYQQEQVMWNGDGGETIFYQSELPYDVPNQAAWSESGSPGTSSGISSLVPPTQNSNGYPSYFVNPNSVCNHTAYGLGIYSFFNQGVNIVDDNAMIVPNAAGIQITDFGTVFLNGSGQISNVINGAGGSASSANPATLVPVKSYTGSGSSCVANVNHGPENGIYTITNVFSGLALEVHGASTSPGAVVDQWTPVNQTNEQWQVTSLGNGTYSLVSVNSGLCLDVTGAKSNNGATLDQWTCVGAANEQFTILQNDDGVSFTILGAQSGLAVEDHGWATTPGSLIDQWTMVGSTNEEWYFHRIG